MIRWLLALHPRTWRAEYGEELRDLLAIGPLTFGVIVDVLLNAARQHVRVHPLAARLAWGLVASAVVELLAVHLHVTVNILWPPFSPVRAVALGVLLACWLPLARWTRDAVHRRAPVSDW